jgi:epoxyqueuosine reductase
LPALLPRVMALLDDPAPVVRGAAVWALARLDPRRAMAERDRRVTDEPDESVCAEWDVAELSARAISPAQ